MTSRDLPLLDFASRYGRDLRHHLEVDEEDLAHALRTWTGLPPFARASALRAAMRGLGVELGSLPGTHTALQAVNVWHDRGRPQVLLHPGLRPPRLEHLLAHELRELVEVALGRANGRYRGLDTRNNARMNPVSDRFAGALLLPRVSTRLVLRDLDYDLVRLAELTGRSLPAVLTRVQEVGHQAERGPRALFWLFEAPWPLVRAGKATLSDLRPRYWANLNGFPARLGGPLGPYASRAFLPGKRGSWSDLRPLVDGLADSKACWLDYIGLAAQPEYEVTLIAEPIPWGGLPWRVLVCAVLSSDAHLLEGWRKRLGVRMETVLAFVPPPGVGKAGPVRLDYGPGGGKCPVAFRR